MYIRYILFFIFALSGFSGLIYESIWSHYLKLFLGHAAYAQTLVLAIFMGGMSLGSWLSSKYSSRWKNLILAYAIIEAAIGLFGIGFHRLFVLQTDFAYLTVLPSLGSTGSSVLFKWLMSTLFILPQSILLGMTFPLMSAGIIRRYPENSGASISILYFSNSIGGVLGVLCSGFILIYQFGLPGTIMTAGFINIFIALLVWLLVSNVPDLNVPSQAIKADEQVSTERNSFYWSMLFVALITGMASFIYEIGWIRMLSLVLGSSTHAFELMLSAFILGLALGGLWIKKRIDRIRSPVRFLAYVQILMGGLALSTLFLYDGTFKLMQFFMKVLTKTDGGYTLFNIVSHGIALIVMLPATFCAGMTLPLITHTLLKERHGEKSIGAVYAANTVGAILGVMIAIHIGMPLLGLKGLISLGAAFDIALGILLFWLLVKASNRVRWGSVITGVLLLLITLSFAHLDPIYMASGIYRRNKLLDRNTIKVTYHRDGKTSTVNLLQFPNGILSIVTNGKPDASINMSGSSLRSLDETTMILAGVLPYMYHPKAEKIANIGFGSGQTTHTLLQAPWVKRVDTIEIEPAMIEAARAFGHRVVSAYTDSRSHFYIDDAKTFFSTNHSQYDIIVSEPSNPWVSGVSSLYTDEFYRLIKRHVRRDGLFVQWIQLYENENYLLASVMKAINKNFEDYIAYTSDNGNLIIIAKPVGKLGKPSSHIFQQAVIKHELSLIHIQSLQDIEMRRLASKRVLQPLFESFAIPVNSDYFPVVDLYSTRARFLRHKAGDVLELYLSRVPALQMLDSTALQWDTLDVNYSKYLSRSTTAYVAMALRDFFRQGGFGKQNGRIPQDIKRHAELVRLYSSRCLFNREPDVYMASIFEIARSTLPYLTPKESVIFWKRLTPLHCGNRLTKLQRDWFALFAAVGARDAIKMSRIAERMLNNKQVRSGVSGRYVLDIAMLGALKQNRRDHAGRLWTKYSKSLYGKAKFNLMTRLLVAHSFPGKKGMGVSTK